MTTNIFLQISVSLFTRNRFFSVAVQCSQVRTDGLLIKIWPFLPLYVESQKEPLIIRKRLCMTSVPDEDEKSSEAEKSADGDFLSVYINSIDI